MEWLGQENLLSHVRSATCYVKTSSSAAASSAFEAMQTKGNPKQILATLAIQLSSRDAAYKWALLGTLDKGISSNTNLKIQVENLLEKPLCSAHGGGLSTIVLVIDVLDELDDEEATKDLLRLGLWLWFLGSPSHFLSRLVQSNIFVLILTIQPCPPAS
jgi:hypothetical protein